jgi:hypothetical protein
MSAQLGAAVCDVAPFSAWVHFGREWALGDERTVRELIEAGCEYFLISGDSSHVINDTIDDIIINFPTDKLILTSEGGIDQDAAFQFLSTRCPSGPPLMRIVSAFGESDANELQIISQMLELLAQASET